MKFIIILVLLLFIVFNTEAQSRLTGIVYDSGTKQPLPCAVVVIDELGIGNLTNEQGFYELTGIPLRRFLVQVKYVGYKTESHLIDFAETTTHDFYLEPSMLESREVIVTGSAFVTDLKRSSLSVEQIQGKQLQMVSSQNIISALTQTAGVSEITTGGAISKPVIRGMSFNRIITLNEGIRQEGQQWGDEHGIEIDEFSADRIEVLKGPASLIYGSDAIGGVINILEPHSPPPGVVRGLFNASYGANNGLSASSLMLEGNYNGFSWRARGTYKNAAPFRTPGYRVYNSAFNETDVSAMLGLQRKWGYAHVHAGIWNSNIGMIEGERDSLTGAFTDPEGNFVDESTLKSRRIYLPFQNVNHKKITSVNAIYFKKGKLNVNAGYQANTRNEFEDDSEAEALGLKLHTATADVKYFFSEKKSLQSAIGLNTMYQQNKISGDELLVPAYQLAEWGVFGTIQKGFEKTTLHAGIRFDARNIRSDALITDTIVYFDAFGNSFSALSAMFGLAHQFTAKTSIKFNAGRAFRSPNIAELSANGVHEGTYRYEIGNNQLNPETTLQFDAEFEFDSKFLTLNASVFFNYIDNFIYTRQINNEAITVDSSEVFPVYRYVQGRSRFFGGEFELDIHPIEAIHFYNSIACVNATNTQTNQPLPMIPALKISNELMFHLHSESGKKLRDPYLKIRLDNYLAQKRVDDFENETPGYSLLSLSLGADFKLGVRYATAFLNAGNLLNTSYIDHLSRLKTVGIQNMGLNVTFGIIVPFSLRNAEHAD